MSDDRPVDRTRLADLTATERATFAREHPRSAELFERAQASLLEGVPMPWMVKWAGPYPIYVETAAGASFRCVDGHDYVDFCLGDTGAMAGHGPAPTIAAVERQLRRGITHMLPTEDAAWVGEELTRRFDQHGGDVAIGEGGVEPGDVIELDDARRLGHVDLRPDIAADRDHPPAPVLREHGDRLVHGAVVAVVVDDHLGPAGDVPGDPERPAVRIGR
jgi:hypothetical protein